MHTPVFQFNKCNVGTSTGVTDQQIITLGLRVEGKFCNDEVARKICKIAKQQSVYCEFTFSKCDLRQKLLAIGPDLARNILTSSYSLCGICVFQIYYHVAFPRSFDAQNIVRA